MYSMDAVTKFSQISSLQPDARLLIADFTTGKK
jgi:hypothetical protein